jgi:hypothetical protein
MFNFPVKDGQLQQYLIVTDTQTSQKVAVKVSLDTMSGAYIVQPQS